MTDLLIDTGLLGTKANQEPVATSAASVPAVVPAPVVPSQALPTGWDLKRAFALMRDLSQEMFPIPDILKKHGVSQTQYDALSSTDYFKRTLEAMTAEWHTAANTPKRLALEALIALEERLPDVVARLGAKTEPLSSVVQLAALLAKIGGLGEQAQTATPSEKFKITINLGADVEKFEKERRPVITVETPAIQSIPEGEGTEPQIQRLTFGP